ncbi:hypothetical protein UT300012_22090 [Paraclostridium bifermentans]
MDQYLSRIGKVNEMLANKRGTKKAKKVKTERVIYKLDRDGNFSEGKESMKSLYDVMHKDENKFSKKGGRKPYRK